MIILVPGLLANSILSVVANVGAITDIKFVTLEDILFNNIALTDVNIIFNNTEARDDSEDSNANLLKNIGDGVSGWYYALRNFALTISFLILILVGIRMAFDSYGQNRARYKKMLVDWVVSLGIIILLDYFIVIILKINTAAVNMLRPGNLEGGESYIDNLFLWAFDISLIKSWGAAIMYSILGIISFTFLVIYIKRMLMTCFLIMIAPVAATFSTFEKIGEGRSKILSSWAKEFCYNVLIQPFHCIVYIVFVGTAMNQLYSSQDTLNFKYQIIAIACTCCLFIGEKIIRTIFGFTKSKSVAAKLFNAAMITSVINNITQLTRGRNNTDDNEGQMPAIMPNGESTEKVLSQGQNKVNLREVPSPQDKGEDTSTKTAPFVGGTKNYESQASGGSGSFNSSSNRGPNVGKQNPRNGSEDRGESKPQKRSETGTEDGEINNPNNGANESKLKKQKTLSKKEIERMDAVSKFLIAAKYYRDTKNPNMSNEQLALRTDQIMQTSMEDIAKTGNVSDVQYKAWITSMERLLKDQGIERPDRYIRDIINRSDMGNPTMS